MEERKRRLNYNKNFVKFKLSERLRPTEESLKPIDIRKDIACSLGGKLPLCADTYKAAGF